MASNFREGDWMCPGCNNHNYASKNACNRCGMPKPANSSMGGGGYMPGMGNAVPSQALPPNAREGDWMCPSCNNHNYASKSACNRCKLPKSGGYGMAGMGGMHGMNGAQNRYSPYGGAVPSQAGSGGGGQGNWTCPSCGNVNYPGRTVCNRCKMPKMQATGGMGMMGMGYGMGGMGYGMAVQGQPPPPPMGLKSGAEFRSGDWMCPACNNHNYSSKLNCNKCGVPKETRIANTGLREGDWVCRQCANHNYASKTECNKCKAPKGDTPGHTAGYASKGGANHSNSRPGDWICAGCGNSNYAHRQVCNRCSMPKSAS